MTYLTYSEKLNNIVLYIQKGWAKTPNQLAAKLQLNERTVLRMISTLKEQGFDIRYNKSVKGYIVQ